MDGHTPSPFDLHPASVIGGLLGSRPPAGAAAADAEPEPDVAAPGLLRRAVAALPRWRRKAKPAVAPGR
ncbi:MAG TPA: hypothetical protein VFR63_04740 [Gaiellaceae bacterium]|nr:hypothetical protein [Gaiellaceae bacterium]